MVQEILLCEYLFSKELVNKIPLFSRNLITFIKYFVLFLVSIILEPSLDVNFLLSLFILLFTKYFAAFLTNIGAPRFAASVPPQV